MLSPTRLAGWARAGLKGLALCVPLVALACTQDHADKESAASASPAPSQEAAAGPSTGASGAAASGEDFLKRLAPVEGDALRLVYRLRGPGGSTGELEVITASGGRRIERWTLALPDAADKAIRGETIQNAAKAWTHLGETPGKVHPMPFADLAKAYEGLDEAKRSALLEVVDAWHGELARARLEHPGERREIVGVSCLEMQMAGQEICMWEEVGLPLFHRSSSFSLEAMELDRSPELSDDAFSLPTAAQGAEVVAAPEIYRLDSEATVAAMARGDASSLALLLTPGLRLPDPNLLESP